ncbi:MAG: glutamine-hydrolyzing carbamoyl-phosphate synthase small subunit [Planctomycetes bacterium]|nr:glutamine-hydrolyzing carbamoyl-phosphate synthase small subunit [Planctomycetota bacterium]
MHDAVLYIEDGRTFYGKRFGAEAETSGEVVFNTALTGYQEILSDPSYAGQIVVMTYPEQGNYGIAAEDFESRRSFARGFVTRSLAGAPSNHRSFESLDSYLKSENVVGITDVDTRALTKHIREFGSLRGIIASASKSQDELEAAMDRMPLMSEVDFAKEVTIREGMAWEEGANSKFSARCPRVLQEKVSIVAVDFGIKYAILRDLRDTGFRVQVVPGTTSAEDILAMNPGGLFLSNGPGDPEACTYAIEMIRGVVGKLPIFGICLGHQLLSLALGAKTYKLDFGHHGANHPVKNLQTDKVEITSQNHCYAVDPDTLPEIAEVTHLNLNDGTVEGIAHREFPAYSLQYHPEASPGPHDSLFYFEKFAKLVRARGHYRDRGESQ